MKTKAEHIVWMIIGWMILLVGVPAGAQGTAFTYQGRLLSGTVLSSGTYDFAFSLYTVNSGGTAVGGPVTNSGVSVSNGLFTAVVDFGSVFTGGSNWLEIAVSTNGANSFSTLAPRQQITPAPYAIYAGNLGGGLAVIQNTNGAPNVIGGSPVNYVAAGVIGATVAGGGSVNYHKYGSTTNRVTASFGTISGGDDNLVTGPYATIGGGAQLTALGAYSTIGGGLNNVTSNSDATVAGGYDNQAIGSDSTVGGGNNNIASGYGATVPGGFANTAAGDFSFAAGNNARALHNGSFVWAGGSSFASTADNQFTVRATGGIRLAGDVQIDGGTAYHYLSLSGGNSLGYLYGSYPMFPDFVTLGYNYYADSSGNGHIPNTGGGTSRVSTGYGEVVVAVGGVNAQPTTTRIDVTLGGVSVYGTFNNSSDRNAKQDFVAVDTADILNKVTKLPLSEWSYKEDAQTRHIGPMGQDFYAAFNVGTDEKHIAPIDESGVAFAAIQALNKKLEAENTDLKQRLAKLEATVEKLSQTR